MHSSVFPLLRQRVQAGLSWSQASLDLRHGSQEGIVPFLRSIVACLLAVLTYGSRTITQDGRRDESLRDSEALTTSRKWSWTRRGRSGGRKERGWIAVTPNAVSPSDRTTLLRHISRALHICCSSKSAVQHGLATDRSKDMCRRTGLRLAITSGACRR